MIVPGGKMRLQDGTRSAAGLSRKGNSCRFAALLAVLACLARCQSGRPNDLKSLVEAEIAFAKFSEASGMKAAFLANLADDAVVFDPLPVLGKPIYRAMPENPALLTWRPAFADIAAAGDLGYTTGPYEFFKSRTEKAPVGQGHYNTIWRRQADGTWKAVLDAGIPHPPLPEPLPVFSAPDEVESLPKAPAVEIAGESDSLRACDAKLSDTAAKANAADVLLGAMAEAVRVYRVDAYPAVGKEAARKLMVETRGPASWTPMNAVVSRSGDLGYTFGAGDGFSYLRVWRKISEAWRIVLDLATPVPPESKKR